MEVVAGRPASELGRPLGENGTRPKSTQHLCGGPHSELGFNGSRRQFHRVSNDLTLTHRTAWPDRSDSSGFGGAPGGVALRHRSLAIPKRRNARGTSVASSQRPPVSPSAPECAAGPRLYRLPLDRAGPRRDRWRQAWSPNGHRPVEAVKSCSIVRRWRCPIARLLHSSGG